MGELWAARQRPPDLEKNGQAMNPKLDKETANDIELLQDLVGRARKAGADAADAVLFEGTSLSHARRLGKTEKLERSESQDLGLREGGLYLRLDRVGDLVRAQQVHAAVHFDM